MVNEQNNTIYINAVPRGEKCMQGDPTPYNMMMEMSNIVKKKLLGKTKALMYFESSLEGDIMNKGKVARTVVHIKCWRK